jgi:hypothetical protein
MAAVVGGTRRVTALVCLSFPRQPSASLKNFCQCSQPIPHIGALGYREGPTLENTGVERVQSTIHNSAGPLDEVMPEVRRDVVMY